MVRDLVVYPDQRITVISSDVRFFDEELHELLEDMKDTMNEHKADGLAAIQIAVPARAMIIRDENGEILELINPRLIKGFGAITTTESTLYLPNIKRDITRYERFTLVYQDREGKDCSRDFEGELGVVVQRKLDYTFGSSFAGRFKAKELEGIEQELAGKGVGGSFESYDDLSNREYFTSMSAKLLFLEFLTLFSPLFNFTTQTMEKIYLFDKVATALIVVFIIIYFIYGKYEMTKRLSCTGCQVINFVNVSLQYLVMAGVLFGLSHWLVNPH
ncbi:MAG: peptide deformylase [Campylobacterales bacterium]|nr:peptide deformylase [Campylobacterales bacterium]